MRIDHIMKMPGGGTFNLHAGQVTDDSEMAISMIHGFLAMKEGLEPDRIA